MRGAQRRSWLKSLSEKLRKAWGPPERKRAVPKKWQQASGDDDSL